MWWPSQCAGARSQPTNTQLRSRAASARRSPGETTRLRRPTSRTSLGPAKTIRATAASQPSRRATSTGTGAVQSSSAARVPGAPSRALRSTVTLRCGRSPPDSGSPPPSRLRRASSTRASARRWAGVRSSAGPAGLANGSTAASTVAPASGSSWPGRATVPPKVSARVRERPAWAAVASARTRSGATTLRKCTAACRSRCGSSSRAAPSRIASPPATASAGRSAVAAAITSTCRALTAPAARAAALAVRSSASRRAVRTHAAAAPGASRARCRSQAAVDAAPAAAAPPPRSKATSRRANSASSWLRAMPSATTSSPRAATGSPASSSPATWSSAPPSRPTGGRPSYSNMCSTVVGGSDSFALLWAVPRSRRPGPRLLLRRRGQRRDEGLLRNLDPADGLHPLLTLLLLLQQLALAADVPAVALGQHVLADCPDVLPGNHSRPDRGLDRHLELLTRDQLAQLGGHRHAVRIGLVLVHDGAKGVHRLALQQDVDLDQVGGLLADRFVVQRGVAAGARLQRVEEVENDLPQRQRVAQLDPVRGQVVHAEQHPPAALAELHDHADVVAGSEQRRPDHRLEDLRDLATRKLARVGDGVLLPGLHHHPVDDVRRRGDQ